MQIFDELKRDHDEIRELLTKISESTDRSAKRKADLLNRLEVALLSHAKAEEMAFYRSILDDEATHDRTLDAVEEHRACEDVLQDLKSLHPDSKAWNEKFRSLKQNLEFHIKEEERDLFKRARRLMGWDEAEEMADIFQETKLEVLQELEA